MTKQRVMLIAVEVLALAALRVVYVLQRKRKLPRGSKVRSIRGRPVYRVPFSWKRKKPQNQPHNLHAGGWTPPPRHDKLTGTPDGSPDA